jgi:hypothetical protein
MGVDLVDFCRGAAFLGAGGGGSPYLGRLHAERVMTEEKPVEIIGVDEVPDDALIIPTAGMGAPTVGIEKLERGDEPTLAFERLERHLGRKAFATMPVEMGGPTPSHRSSSARSSACRSSTPTGWAERFPSCRW